MHWQEQDQLGTPFSVFVPIAVPVRLQHHPGHLIRSKRDWDPLTHHREYPNEEALIRRSVQQQDGSKT